MTSISLLRLAMNRKLVDELVSLIKNLEILDIDEKKSMIERLRYMPEWKMVQLKNAVIKLHQEEEKFKSDVSRLELKYEMELKELVGKEVE